MTATIEMTTKKCGTCEQVLPTSAFYAMRRRGRLEIQNSCKECQKR